MPKTTHYEIYLDGAGEYRWRLLAGNGRTIADSGEGYANYQDCYDGVQLVKDTSDSPIEKMA
jgi:uncharacterized protein YegP (UPF0339 family)